jgi:hypothetical protein
MMAFAVSFHYHRAGHTRTHSMKSAIERTSTKCPREKCHAGQSNSYGNAIILGASIRRILITMRLDDLLSIILILFHILFYAIYYVFNTMFLIFSGNPTERNATDMPVWAAAVEAS